MQGGVYNSFFNDVYFSQDGGLAESRHVFLGGNDLPKAWAGKARFTIAETGFGTGLNFLAAWELFSKTTDSDQFLDYISFERYPLRPLEIRGALAEWRGELGPYLDLLLQRYPLRLPGFHRILVAPRIRLTLILDDVNRALPELDVPGGVNAWFLDGFSPAKNPEMWSERVFREVARLSAPGATAATFSAARMVRDGLADVGFAVEKRPGHGRKKDMTTAIFSGVSGEGGRGKSPGSIAIIGGGLAGSTCAHVMGAYGIGTTIFEKNPPPQSVAAGTGRVAGLYNPRLSAHRSPESDFYTAGYAAAVRRFTVLQQQADIGFKFCGSLHLITDDDRRKKLEGACKTWDWPAEHMAVLNAEEASARAGVSLSHDALFLPDSGSVSPFDLCRAYTGVTGMTEVRPNTGVTALSPAADGGWLVNGQKFDTVILACAVAVREFAGLSWLPINTVRGQVTAVAATPQTQSLQCHLSYGGYMSAAEGDRHWLGATFQKWLSDTALIPIVL